MGTKTSLPRPVAWPPGWPGLAWLGLAWPGLAGLAWFGLAWPSLWLGLPGAKLAGRTGLAGWLAWLWPGWLAWRLAWPVWGGWLALPGLALAWLGLAWPGLAWLGGWPGLACPG